MRKRTFFILPLILVLTALLTALPAKAQTNLLSIPDDWNLYENNPSSYTANVHLDNDVLFNGSATVRIDPHTGGDTNTAREVNSNGIAVEAGDNVLFYCWIKNNASVYPEYNEHEEGEDLYGNGGRIGIDFYQIDPENPENVIISVSAIINGLVEPDGDPVPGYPHGQAIGSYVPWNTTSWTLQTINVTVPTGYNVTSMIAWLQVTFPIDTGVGWFGESQLYINEEPEQAAPYVPPSTTIGSGSGFDSLVALGSVLAVFAIIIWPFLPKDRRPF